jgi:hypothetical protein
MDAKSTVEQPTMRHHIFYALATIRGVVAYAEETRTPMCVLSLDFQEDIW